MRGLAVIVVFGVAGGCAASRPAPTHAEPSTTDLSTRPPAGPPSEPVKQGSGLHFSVTPADAMVFIDGKAVGKVADLEGTGGVLSVKPGIYQVSLKRPGFVTWRAEVTVGDGAEAIQVIMVKSQ